MDRDELIALPAVIDVTTAAAALAVYGFLTTYGLAAIALPLYLKRNHHLTPGTLLLSIATTLAMLLALAGTLYPVPERPYNWLPYVYLTYILCGMAWFAISTRNQPTKLSAI